jgi:hypothetical protein
VHTEIQDFTRRLIQMIVDQPDAVKITPQTKGDSVVLTIRVAPGELGMVIGKHGDMIKAIRLLTNACATRLGKRVHLEVEEPDGSLG